MIVFLSQESVGSFRETTLRMNCTQRTLIPLLNFGYSNNSYFAHTLHQLWSTNELIIAQSANNY